MENQDEIQRQCGGKKRIEVTEEYRVLRVQYNYRRKSNIYYSHSRNLNANLKRTIKLLSLQNVYEDIWMILCSH